MSFEPNDIDHQLQLQVLLSEILIELKKLSLMVAEATDTSVTNEDVQ